MTKEVPHHHQPYGLIVSVASIGGFMTTLDVGIINIALPYLKVAFNTNLTTITWTITAYTLILSATIIFFGRLGDHTGRLRVFRRGIIVFVIASIIMQQVLHHLQGTAGAFNRMIHNFGISLGAAMAAFFIEVYSGSLLINIAGYQYIWLAGMVVVSFSLCLLLLIKIKDSNKTMNTAMFVE